MAVLTTEELVGLRREVARRLTEVSWTKSQMNAAVQALEDASSVVRDTLAAAIGGAAGGPTLDDAQKDAVILSWMGQRLLREEQV